MATKKGKKKTKSKPTSTKKSTRSKRAPKKKTAKKLTPKKKGATSSKKAGTAKPAGKKATRKIKASKSRASQSAGFEPRRESSRSGGQAGDLQGLRDVESADSESVSELLEEGNAFEADVVAGVEHVEDDEEQEVHTHEVPEDDVPEEYLDQD